MRYGILSSLEYDSGRILLFSSRFDNVFTGNQEQSMDFCRSCFEWVGQKSSSDLISLLTVNVGIEDGGYRVFDLTNGVNIDRGELANLSDSNYLKSFDVVCVFGANNSMSPLIRLAIEEYVSTGGGLIISDVHVDQDYIVILDDMSPVFCLSSGVNLPPGRSYWTINGASHGIYDRRFSSLSVQMLNTVSELNFSEDWKLLYVFDTSIEKSDDEKTEEIIEGSVYVSSDYDIPGDRIVGYFSGIYKNGVLSVDESA